MTIRGYEFEYDVRQKCTLYIPKGSYNVYWTAPGWGDFKNIVEE